jgi:hypothetical protein
MRPIPSEIPASQLNLELVQGGSPPSRRSLLFPDKLVIAFDAIVQPRLGFDEHVLDVLKRPEVSQRGFVRTQLIRDNLPVFRLNANAKHGRSTILLQQF